MTSNNIGKPLYYFYIFDIHCNCIFYKNFYTETEQENWKEKSKLIYGIYFSLSNMSQKLKTTQTNENVLNFKTENYQLHSFTTASRLTFILLADCADDRNWRQVLWDVYEVYVDLVCFGFSGEFVKRGKESVDLMENAIFCRKFDEYVFREINKG